MTGHPFRITLATKYLSLWCHIRFVNVLINFLVTWIAILMLHDSSCSHLLAHNNPDQQVKFRVVGSPAKQIFHQKINFHTKRGHKLSQKRWRQNICISSLHTSCSSLGPFFQAICDISFPSDNSNQLLLFGRQNEAKIEFAVVLQLKINRS